MSNPENGNGDSPDHATATNELAARSTGLLIARGARVHINGEPAAQCNGFYVNGTGAIQDSDKE